MKYQYAMAFSSLHSGVTHVPTKPTTAAALSHVLLPTAVFTYLLYLPRHLLHAHVLSPLLCSTFYVLPYVHNALLIYIVYVVLRILQGYE